MDLEISLMGEVTDQDLEDINQLYISGQNGTIIRESRKLGKMPSRDGVNRSGCRGIRRVRDEGHPLQVGVDRFLTFWVCIPLRVKVILCILISW